MPGAPTCLREAFPVILHRRDLILGAGALAAAPPSAWGAPSPAERIAAIEKRIGGRLGVAVLNTANGARIAYRADERFAMCSTFKAMAVAAVLRRVDTDLEHLDRRVPYGPADLQEYAPTTRAHVAEGALTVEGLCEAAVTLSDNTAANLLLASLGGPAGVTRFARSIGDSVTRLDRNEPTLNSALPGDPRDTTSPTAMLGSLRALLLGRALSPASRARLTAWMVACSTGGKRLRAGLPADWRAGDKTGTGANASTNTIAILWPPRGAPVLVTVYSVGSAAGLRALEAAQAEIAALIVRWVG
jgi:beta-lactamase class A